MKDGVSIIICCFNSSERLPKTLYHIANQKQINNFSVELILVNNNSTDDTKSVAANEWIKYVTNIDFKIVDEPVAGLSAAREKGVSCASFEFIIFCDDDNWLDELFVNRAYYLMNKFPNIGALGGQSMGVSDVEFPEWWNDHKESYAVGKQAEVSGDISNRFYLWGAGLVSRKSVLQQVFDNHFPLLLSDRKANEMISGGDTEICMRILILGYSLYYSDDLVFVHYMSPGRLSWNYYQKLRNSFVSSSFILTKYRTAIMSFNLPFGVRLKESILKFSSLIISTIGFSRKNRSELLNQIALYWQIPLLARDQDYKLIIDYKKRYGRLFSN